MAVKATWSEAHQIAGEIADELQKMGFLIWELPYSDGWDAQTTERIAKIIFDKRERIWSEHLQQWVSMESEGAE